MKYFHIIGSSRLSTSNSLMETLVPVKFRWVSPFPCQRCLMTAILRCLTGGNVSLEEGVVQKRAGLPYILNQKETQSVQHIFYFYI